MQDYRLAPPPPTLQFVAQIQDQLVGDQKPLRVGLHTRGSDCVEPLRCEFEDFKRFKNSFKLGPRRPRGVHSAPLFALIPNLATKLGVVGVGGAGGGGG